MLLHDYHIANFKIFPQIEGKLTSKHTSEYLFTLLSYFFLSFEKFLLEVVVKLALECVSAIIAFEFQKQTEANRKYDNQHRYHEGIETIQIFLFQNFQDQIQNPN